MLHFAEGNTPLANAFADLSVTGQLSYEKFAASPPTEAAIIAWARQQPDPQIKAGLARFQDPALTQAAGEAIDRAYKVVHMVRQGHRGSPERKALGWVAVSGEDDEPHWPVNVPATDFPQYELTVSVDYALARPPNPTVRTRYMIAHTNPPAGAQPPAGTGRQLPVAVRPVIAADAEILLYVHGMDSRTEEADDMARALVALGKARGKNYVMIAMDLPTSGYADKLDHRRISSLNIVGDARGALDFDAHDQHNAPLLDFIESFIVSFVDTLDRQAPVKSKIRAIIGGSLGGNMSLRLGRRTDLPWLKAVVPWSPASIWDSLADGADILKHAAVRKGWDRAGGDPNELEEQDDSRKNFFQQAFDATIDVLSINIVPAQPTMWYRGDWPCLPSAMVADRIERQEIYNPMFRRWHWRLGMEQLVYSHQTKDASGLPLYMHDTKTMLLGCGKEDKFNYSDICPTTQDVSSKMTNTPGAAQFLEHTGHSIHNERPVLKWSENSPPQSVPSPACGGGDALRQAAMLNSSQTLSAGPRRGGTKCATSHQLLNSAFSTWQNQANFLAASYHPRKFLARE
jgi:hypothetical protein